jgi:hypothetical protein
LIIWIKANLNQVVDHLTNHLIIRIEFKQISNLTKHLIIWIEADLNHVVDSSLAPLVVPPCLVEHLKRVVRIARVPFKQPLQNVVMELKFFLYRIQDHRNNLCYFFTVDLNPQEQSWH